MVVPQYLQKLCELLEQINDVSSNQWKLFVKHPSLWHWKSRFSYTECVWIHYVNANPTSYTYQHMINGFSKITILGWKENIHYKK